MHMIELLVACPMRGHIVSVFMPPLHMHTQPAEVVSALEPRVSVLFCDILCFTQLAETYKPSAVVALLDG